VTSGRDRWTFAAAAFAACLYAAWAAWRHAWVCDDAFISFRYAENLVHGLGLVYNAGERVEGYSNFLWTLWSALGIRLGADPERWAAASSFACNLGALALLAWNAWRMRGDSPGAAPALPVAALVGATLLEWNIYATGGLETSLYAFLVTLAYVLLAGGRDRARPVAWAGFVLGLAAMTRPDGPLLAALAGSYLWLVDRRRPRALGAFLGTFLITWVPFTVWRVSYYGDFFPNPYYAKSAGRAWIDQGAAYVLLYFAKYWPLALGAAGAAFLWIARRGRAGAFSRRALGPWNRRVGLAMLLAFGYTAYIVYVGGDFMFGRLLIPVTPLFLVLLEAAVARVAAGRPAAQWIAAGAAAAAVTLTPHPVPGDRAVRGIVNEWAFYTRERAAQAREQGLTLRPFFAGLPVRVAFLGSEARLVYYARPAVAIESQTGLTDRFIAHQPLRERGRVGHEKVAPLEYLINTRGANFIFHPLADRQWPLDRVIPRVEVDFAGVRGRVLSWDPALMDSLRARGAVVRDLSGH